MIVWCDRQTVARVRRHPLLAAAAVASIMGIGFAIPKIVFERYRPSLVAFVFVVSACSFFALVVVVAARLGLVAQHSAHPRTATVTVTAMSAAIPAAVTFRNVLWWTVGTTESASGLTELVQLCALWALATGVAVTAVFRLLDSRRHSA